MAVPMCRCTWSFALALTMALAFQLPVSRAAVSRSPTLGTPSGSQVPITPRRTVHRFNHPSDVAVGVHGNVFVANDGNRRIIKLSPSGETLVGRGGSGGVATRLRSL